MRIFKLTYLHIKRIIKNKSVLILTLLMPALVMCLVTFFTNGKSSSTNSINIDIVNHDKGQLGAALLKEFNDNQNFSVTTLSEAEATERVQHNTVAAAIIIPDNFTDTLKNNNSPSIKLLKLNSGNSDVVIESKLNAFIANNLITSKVTEALKLQTLPETVSTNTISTDLAKEVNSEKIQVTSKDLIKDKSNSYGGIISVNLAISFMMFTIIFIVNEITERRNDGTLTRSLSSPNSNIIIIGSFVLAFLAIGWIEVLLMFGSTSLLFKVSWGSSFAALFLLFTVLILVVLGMGLLLCRLVKSSSNISTVAMLITQVTCLLGGSYMPAQYFPDFLKKISYFMPQSWAVDALNNIVLKNQGVMTILPDIGILLLFAVAFFTASASTLRKMVQE